MPTPPQSLSGVGSSSEISTWSLYDSLLSVLPLPVVSSVPCASISFRRPEVPLVVRQKTSQSQPRHVNKLSITTTISTVSRAATSTKHNHQTLSPRSLSMTGPRKKETPLCSRLSDQLPGSVLSDLSSGIPRGLEKCRELQCFSKRSPV